MTNQNDILNQYIVSKQAIDKKAKELMATFENTDFFGVIASTKSSWAEISEDKHNPENVLICLMNMKDTFAQVTFSMNREKVFEDDNSSYVVKAWLEASKEYIMNIFISKGKQFFKEFKPEYFEFIKLLIDGYQTAQETNIEINELVKRAAAYRVNEMSK